MGEPLGKRVLEERQPARIVLHVHRARRTDRARDQLGRVTAARSQVLDLHPRTDLEEVEHLGRLAPRIEGLVGGAPIRSRDDGVPRRPAVFPGRGGRRGRGRGSGLARQGANEEEGDALHVNHT